MSRWEVIDCRAPWRQFTWYPQEGSIVRGFRFSMPASVSEIRLGVGRVLASVDCDEESQRISGELSVIMLTNPRRFELGIQVYLLLVEPPVTPFTAELIHGTRVA